VITAGALLARARMHMAMTIAERGALVLIGAQE